MTILKIILITVGVAFIMFGYEIYFQKKYNLINGFECKKGGSNIICIGNRISSNWHLRNHNKVNNSQLVG